MKLNGPGPVHPPFSMFRTVVRSGSGPPNPYIFDTTITKNEAGRVPARPSWLRKVGRKRNDVEDGSSL